MMKRRPALRHHADPLTNAMVEFYNNSQDHFTADMQAHYIYSPRELTRWKISIYESLEPLEEVEDLVRLFIHEGLRLFEDRLVFPHEKVWCNEALNEVAQKYFPSANAKCMERPIYFTNFMS
jgi:dynein heavy chain 1